MKAHHLALCGMALLIAVPMSAQEGTALSQVPDAVREAIDREAGPEPVKRITRHTVNGRTTYLIELERDHAPNPRFRISDTGELLPHLTVPTDMAPPAPGPAGPAPVTYDSVVSLADLSEAVQQTVRQEAQGREIADIDRETWQGRTVYEVEFRAEGRNPQVHVAEDGAVVQPEQERRGLRDFFLGTQLADTPAAVQSAILREAAGRPVEDIDVERRTGSLVYEVKIRDAQTGGIELHIDSNGRVVQDSRAAAPQPQP